MPALPTSSVLTTTFLRLPRRSIAPLRETQPAPSRSASSRDLLRASFSELNRIASTLLLSASPSRGIDPRTLVNEAARHSLGASGLQDLQDRGAYFAYLANALRRIASALVLQSPNHQPANLSCPGLPEQLSLAEMLTALDRLDTHSPRHAQIAVLRLFGGLSHQEVAQQLGITPVRAEVGWRRVCEWFAARQARN